MCPGRSLYWQARSSVPAEPMSSAEVRAALEAFATAARQYIALLVDAYRPAVSAISAALAELFPAQATPKSRRMAGRSTLASIVTSRRKRNGGAS